MLSISPHRSLAVTLPSSRKSRQESARETPYGHHDTTHLPTPSSPADETRPEFTFRALLLGSLFGIIFGAVTVYVGLRAGLTVAASIPIAVLSISILRAFGRASILENNIVQTTGNAGQSIASGVIFTLPALVFLGFDLEYSRIFMLALIGGWLGVLFMIPLRRQLIVEEHGTLPYPEGTACADVLIAGERGGSLASRVFLGLGLGGLYTLFQNENLFSAWPGTPELPARLRPAARPQRRIHQRRRHAGIPRRRLHHRPARRRHHLCRRRLLLARPHAADLLLRQELGHPIYPGTVPIAQMGPSDLWATYIRPMGAGAVAAAGLITLLKTLPTIFGALTAGFKTMRPGAAARRSRNPSAPKTTSPWASSIIGSLLIVALMFVFLQFKPVPGALRRMGRQPRRFAARRRLRIPLRHRQLAHRRPDRLLGQSRLRHDHRHAHGHLRHLSRQGLDRPRLRRARHHHRRRGLHRRIQLRRHLAGPQDRLHHRRHALASSRSPS